MSWAPRPAETGLAVLGGLAMAALGFTVDPTGRWLVWAAAALLFGIPAVDVLIRPRLRADDFGVAVRALTGRTEAIWSQIDMGVRRHQRFGRSVATLELDVRLDDDEKLIVLGRRELGTDPEEVLEQLTRLRARL